MDSVILNEGAMEEFVIAIKLSINHNLFNKGYITEEMYDKAKEMILKIL